MLTTTRVHYILAVALLAASGCGNGCGTEPTPGGFPSADRASNGTQVRISDTGFAAITDDPQAVIGGLLPGGLSITVPPTCSGSTPLCCPGGVPDNDCGPVQIDLAKQAGDAARLEIHPLAGQHRLDLVMRARVRTGMDLPISVFGTACGIHIDTAPGPEDDIELDTSIDFVPDPTTGTTRGEVGDVTILKLTADDVTITGGGLCSLGSVAIPFVLGQLTATMENSVRDAIAGQLCKACASGDVADCGPFATACSSDGVCQEGTQCLQEIGLAGRLRGSSVFGSFSPGTTGAIDLYEVAGGYASTEGNGLALGMLSGLLPGGAVRDRCGPPATAPVTASSLPISTFFQGNTRPDTNEPFGLAIGLHKQQLDQFAYAGYEGGFLCLTVGTATVSLLNTDTIGLVSSSVTNLTTTAPVFLGLRPQSPPTITLGLNTFDGATVTEPLLDINFSRMEIDFFAQVEGQDIRLFTLVTDLHLPVALQPGDAGIEPVLGNLDGAFTNLSVKNSEAVLESPEELAQRFPSLLALALPQLASGLGAFQLPTLGGLAIDVSSITAVDDKSFMAIFANLTPAATTSPRVETVASVASTRMPTAAELADASRWTRERTPSAALSLVGADREWSWRLDGGLWSGWSAAPQQTVTSRGLWIAGMHRLEVRARRAGVVGSVDRTPVELPLMVRADDTSVVARNDLHGTAEGSGCSCDTTGGIDTGAVLPLAGVAAFLLLRRRRRTAVGVRVWRAGAATMLLALTAGPACDCNGSDKGDCGDVACLPGELAHGAIGRYTSIASDATRVVVATYDEELGDLLVIDGPTSRTPIVTPVDGVPIDAIPTHGLDTYRGGIAEAGPDVGINTSIALAGGLARVAYQDQDTRSLKISIETAVGVWSTLVLDQVAGADVGHYTSITIDHSGKPVIAYLATAVPGAGGVRTSELRLARATTVSPVTNAEWVITTVASAPASCAGTCGDTEACVTTDPMGGEACVATSTTCSPACSDTQACAEGTCREAVATSAVATLPRGVGLFPNVLVLVDGSLGIVHYDANRTALLLHLETTPGSGVFEETILDGADGADRGMWASAALDAAGVIHVAYQEALGDQLMYTTWAGTPGTPEIVDDGQRAGEFRTHPVGASATLFFRGGTPAVAYQDAMTADVLFATKGTPWTIAPVAAGPLLDGFHIAASATDPAFLAWDSLDPAATPPSSLVVRTAP